MLSGFHVRLVIAGERAPWHLCNTRIFTEPAERQEHQKVRRHDCALDLSLQTLQHVCKITSVLFRAMIFIFALSDEQPGAEQWSTNRLMVRSFVAVTVANLLSSDRWEFQNTWIPEEPGSRIFRGEGVIGISHAHDHSGSLQCGITSLVPFEKACEQFQSKGQGEATTSFRTDETISVSL